jgi:hypothetical protein
VPSPPTITPILVAELLVEAGVRWPVYVHVVDHPDARVLVDTGMTELRPEVADMDPRIFPLSEQAFDLDGIDIVVNTHLHFDHCGGNHLFAGKPIYVQQVELDDARGDDYTIREWVDAPGVQYVPLDGEHELLPGVRLLPAPGHSRARRAEHRGPAARARARPRARLARTRPRAVATAERELGQALLVIPGLVVLAPLLLIGLGVRELALQLGLRLCVLGTGMLERGIPAAHRREADDDERDGDHGEDEPRDHRRNLPRRGRSRRLDTCAPGSTWAARRSRS